MSLGKILEFRRHFFSFIGLLKENLQEIRKKRKSTNVQSIEKRGEEVLINNVTAAAAARAAVASVVAVVSNILNSIIQ